MIENCVAKLECGDTPRGRPSKSASSSLTVSAYWKPFWPKGTARKRSARRIRRPADKYLKEGYGFAAFSLHNFWATEAVMIMNALVFHNLVHYLNRNILSGQAPVHQLKTLRSKYFTLPAQLGYCGGYPVLRLAARNRSFRGKITYFLERIDGLPWRLNCNAVDGGGGIS